MAPDVYTPYAKSQVRFRAKQLCRRPGFRSSDREDVEQEIWLYLLSRAADFDPHRASLNTFIDRMVRCGAAQIARKRQRQIRATDVDALSLETTMISSPDGEDSLRSLVTKDDVLRRRGTSAPDEFEVVDEQEALDTVVATMPPELRRIAELLKHHSPRAVAHQLGMSQRAVSNAMEKILDCFDKAGVNLEIW
jgi:RNA polymerase sigma factor (sigma-70 family)